MRTKAGLLLTAFAFLLASVATGVAQQNPAAGGNGRIGLAGVERAG